MAQRTFVEHVDDLEGGPAAGTVSFQLDGRELEIDLSEKNAAKLRAIFAPYVAAGRRLVGLRRRAPGRAKLTSGRSREESQQMRAWLRDNGYDLADRGRIPAELIEAHRTGTTAAEAAPGSELARHKAAAR